MIEECISNCNDYNTPGSDLILKKIFGNRQDEETVESILEGGPIQWLNGSGFSAASLDIVYYRILSNLPYYKSNPHELTSKGLMVPGEVKDISMRSPINLLVCDANYGCLEVAEELREVVAANSDEIVHVYDAEEYLSNEINRAREGDEEDNNANTNKRNNSNRSQRQSLLPQSEEVGHRPTFLLLYLNEFLFGNGEENDAQIAMIVESCINNTGIHIILVHDQDTAKGACKFNNLIRATPQYLVNEPLNLYKDLAIPLYSVNEYRVTSLMMILNKMVIVEPELRQTKKFEFFKKSTSSIKRLFDTHESHVRGSRGTIPRYEIEQIF